MAEGRGDRLDAASELVGLVSSGAGVNAAAVDEEPTSAGLLASSGGISVGSVGASARSCASSGGSV